MAEPTERCDNCLNLFPQSKIATHFGYCRKNIKKCTQCGGMYDINNKEEHDQQFHKKLPCPFCKALFSSADLNPHLKSCPKKTQFCQYCQLNVPTNQFPTHLKACEARTNTCDRCLKPIPNKDYFTHFDTCDGIFNKSTGASTSYQPNKNHKDRFPKDQKDERDYYGIPYKKQANPRNKNVETYQKPIIKGKQADLVKKNSGSQAQQTETFSRNSIRNKATSQTRRQIFNPTGIKRQEERSIQKANLNGAQIRKVENNKQMPKVYQANGVKRQIRQAKKEPVTKEIKEQQKYNEQASGRKRERIFDAKQYRGQHSKQISHETNQESFNARNHRKLQQFDEDEQLQKAIMQSIENKKSSFTNYESIPKEFQTEELMRASWSSELDVEKQRAIYEDLQQKSKKSTKR